jgi:hypothetical protein
MQTFGLIIGFGVLMLLGMAIIGIALQLGGME